MSENPPPCDLAIVGRLVLPDRDGPVRGEVRIIDGRIAAVTVPGGDAPAAERVDVGHSMVLPGVVDSHVHCLSDPHEGITAATRAAAAGGVTTVVEMPYDAGAPVMSADVLSAKRVAVERAALVDVALLGTVHPERGAADVQPLVDAGACGFKVSLFCTHAERFPRIPDGVLLEVLGAIARSGSRSCVHAENDEIIKPLITRLRATAEATTDARTHARSRPPVSETEAVLKILEFARAMGTPIHLSHLSLPRSVDLARWYAAQGATVSVETCPHYLAFDVDDLIVQGGLLKMNPPLRERDDVEAMWARVADGTIDVVASDHAPWALEHKVHRNVFDNRSGLPGVETLLPVVLDGALGRGIPVTRIAHVLATTPARLWGLDHCKGSIRPGLDADLVVVDPDAEHVVNAGALHSNAGWSPWEGRRLRGRVTATYLRGTRVWDGAAVSAEPGQGRFVGPRREATVLG